MKQFLSKDSGYDILILTCFKCDTRIIWIGGSSNPVARRETFLPVLMSVWTNSLRTSDAEFPLKFWWAWNKNGSIRGTQFKSFVGHNWHNINYENMTHLNKTKGRNNWRAKKQYWFNHSKATSESEDTITRVNFSERSKFLPQLRPSLRKGNIACCGQCDHIARFIALWATFQSLWRHLFCPNQPHY